MIESWKFCRENNRYQVSNLGNIRSVRFMKNLKGALNSCGYLRVQLGDSKNKYFIHRLVLNNFNDGFSNKIVNHKNGIKTDNRLCNLEWVTHKENRAHADKNGMIKYARGEECRNSKLKLENVLFIRKSNMNSNELAKIFNVSARTIRDVLNQKTWRLS